MNADRFDFWKKLQHIAINNMNEHKRSGFNVLIEVAAQHPLNANMTPGPEFSVRLDMAMEVYWGIRRKNEEARIYVPGSRHMLNGIADRISLSEAGKKYLCLKGIPENDIFADEANERFRKEGVYNSSDECYVASRLFDEGKFKMLYSVCAPHQIMRKALSYIRFGYIPQFVTASTYGYSYMYVDEMTNISEVFNDDYALQINNAGAEDKRRNRNPDYAFKSRDLEELRNNRKEMATWINRQISNDITDWIDCGKEQNSKEN